MDTKRYELLRLLPHGVSKAVQAQASANGVTVDEVIAAMLGRRPAQAGAVAAASAVATMEGAPNRDVMDKIAAQWPYTCGGCGDSFEHKARPAECPRTNCTVSLDGGKAARDKAARDAARAEREALGKDLAEHSASDT